VLVLLWRLPSFVIRVSSFENESLGVSFHTIEAGGGDIYLYQIRRGMTLKDRVPIVFWFQKNTIRLCPSDTPTNY